MKYFFIFCIAYIFIGCSNRIDIPKKWVGIETDIAHINGRYLNQNIDSTFNLEEQRVELSIKQINEQFKLSNILNNNRNHNIKYVDINLSKATIKVTLLDNSMKTIDSKEHNISISHNDNTIEIISNWNCESAVTNVVVIGCEKNYYKLSANRENLFIEMIGTMQGAMILPIPFPVSTSNNRWYKYKKVDKKLNN
jgi:hypothetical protein